MVKPRLKKKHVPMRTCIVTRERLPKDELIRLVKNKLGEIQIDVKGKLPGRGANIKADKQVFRKAVEKNRLSKALRLGRSLTNKERSSLIKQFDEIIEERLFRKSNKPVKIRVKKEDMKKLKIDNVD